MRADSKEAPMAVEVNADTFENEVLKSELPVLVDFWGPNAAPAWP